MTGKTQTVTLRLVADGGQLVGEVKTSRQQLEGLGVDGQKAGQKASRGLDSTRREAKAAGDQVSSLRRQVQGLVAAYVSIQGLQRLSGITDEYAAITAQTQLATRTQEDFAAAQQEIFSISQDTSTQLSSTAELFARASRSTRELGIEQERILGITETINQAFAVSQTEAGAQANAITQLTQAFAGGVLRAEEFNSVIENAPRLAEALADGMGVGMGELRRQVNDGEVTVERMIAALEDQADEIAKEFGGMSLTIGRGWIQIDNAIKRYIGTADQARGVSTGVADAMSATADKIDLVADSAIKIGFAALAVGAGRAAAAIQGKVIALSSSIAATNASNQIEDAAALTALRKAQADNSAATSALNLARAEANLARGTNAQTIALNNQLAAMKRAATARGALNAATAAYTATTRRATLASRVFSTAIGALGGPLGIAVTGLTALFFWTQRNNSIADDMEPTVRTVRELADEATRLRNGGNLLSDEQTASIARAREEINRAAQAIGILQEQRERALDRGDTGVARELMTEINALLSGIEDRSDAIRTIQDALKGATGSATDFGGSLSKADQELAILNRQLELMRDGTDASTAALKAQIEAATGTERAILEARLEIAQMRDDAKGSAEPLASISEEMRELNSQRIESLFDSAFVANLSEVEQQTIQLQRRATDLRELYARTGENRFLEELEAVEAKMDSLGDTAGDMTDEIRRVFETRFGGGLSDELLGTLQGIEELRTALGGIDAPFTGAIDRMLQGLQQFSAAGEAAADKQFGMYAAGIGQMLSGVQGLAQEGSAAYKVLGTASAAAAVASVAAAPWPANLALIPAMIGLMQSLGFGVGGGGSSAGALDVSSSSGLRTSGTVLGDPDGANASLEAGLDKIAEIGNEELRIANQMAASLSNIESALAGVAGEFARFAGFSGVQGVQLSGSVGNLTATAGTESDSIFDQVARILAGDFQASEAAADSVSSDLTRGIQQIFDEMGEGISAGLEAFGFDAQEALDAFRNISLDGIDFTETDNVDEALNELFSAMGDSAVEIVSEVVGFSIDQFHRVGEGALETLTRVATNVQSAQTALERIGAQLDATRLGVNIIGDDRGIFGGVELTAEFSPERLAQLSTAMVEAAGGVDQLLQSSRDFTEAFLGEEQAIANQTRELGQAFDALGVQMPETREGFAELVQGITVNDEASAQLVSQLLSLAPALDEVFAAAEAVTASALDVQREFGLAPSAFENTLQSLGLVVDELPRTESGMRSFIASLSEADQAALRPFIGSLQDLVGAATAAVDIERERQSIQQQIASAELDILRAQGGENAARALERERQTAATAESNRELLQHLFALQDQAVAARDAAAAARDAAAAQREQEAASLDVLRAFDLAPSAFEAVVESLGLVTAELPRTADAMGQFLLSLSDAQRAALQPFISELQGLTSMQTSVPATTAGGSTYAWMTSGGARSRPAASNDDFETELRNAFQRESTALEQQISRFNELSDGLQRFARSLSAANDEFGNTARLQAEYDRQVQRALEGDQAALSDLPGVAEALTRQLRDTATNELELRRGIARIQADSFAAAEIAGTEASLAEQQLESLRDQVSALINIEESVRTVAEILSGAVVNGQALRSPAAPPRVLESAAPVRPAPPVVRSDERLLREIAALRREVSELRAENDSALRAVAAHTADAARSARDISDRHELWDADGLPPERAVA